MQEGDERDIPLTEAVDRAVRGAAHGSDIEAFLRADRRLFVTPDRGYAVLGGNGVNLLAALDEDAARDLLLAVLAARPADQEVARRVDHRRAAVGGARGARRGARA